MTNIRNERDDITIDSIDNKRIIRKRYKANKYGNWDEMDKILGKYEPPKNFPTKKTLGLDSFAGKFYQIFIEEIISILLKLFQKIKKGGNIF